MKTIVLILALGSSLACEHPTAPTEQTEIRGRDAPASAPKPKVCREVYHPQIVRQVGPGSFVVTPAWVETICT